MKNPLFRLIAQLLLVSSLMASGLAMAQAEPSMNQIYATAQAGKLDEAQTMVQQVLVSHPNSAKAHFVQAELYARQGRLDRARQSLATAEKNAPGLPFAKADAVQALRAQLAAAPATAAAAKPGGGVTSSYAAPQAPASSANWALPLLLAGGVIAIAYFVFRRRAPAPVMAQEPAFAQNNGLTGPQTFGAGPGAMQPAGYPQQGYPQAGYPPAAGSGLGGRIMGGVATGLAVGAGVMAAEAIGRNLMGGHDRSSAAQGDSFSNHDYTPVTTNTDMGGQNFGVNDTSWDDGASADGGGSDWDN